MRWIACARASLPTTFQLLNMSQRSGAGSASSEPPVARARVITGGDHIGKKEMAMALVKLMCEDEATVSDETKEVLSGFAKKWEDELDIVVAGDDFEEVKRAKHFDWEWAKVSKLVSSDELKNAMLRGLEATWKGQAGGAPEGALEEALQRALADPEGK